MCSMHAGVNGFLLKERQNYPSTTTVGSTATQASAQLLKNNYGSTDTKRTNPTALDSQAMLLEQAGQNQTQLLVTVTPSPYE